MSFVRYVYSHSSNVDDGWHGDWLVAPYLDGKPMQAKIIECGDASEAVFKVLSTLTPSERRLVTKVNVKRFNSKTD